ncbi:uncharacterized protein [Dermacentor albipictus]|uniref:uncharacterized protein n=1 Tax=Dermacentor albipictus TaxID=60249 RepID=UPI0038FBF126
MRGRSSASHSSSGGISSRDEHPPGGGWQEPGSSPVYGSAHTDDAPVESCQGRQQQAGKCEDGRLHRKAPLAAYPVGTSIRREVDGRSQRHPQCTAVRTPMTPP